MLFVVVFSLKETEINNLVDVSSLCFDLGFVVVVGFFMFDYLFGSFVCLWFLWFFLKVQSPGFLETYF